MTELLMYIMQLSDGISDFLIAKEIEEGSSPNTIKAYNYDLQGFSKCLSDPEITSISVFQIRRFLKELHDRNYTKYGLARKIACLKSFFKFCEINEMVTKNPMNPIKSPKIRAEEALPKFLSREETLEVFSKVKVVKGTSRAFFSRLELVLRVLYSTMGRISEICGLKIKDVDLERNIVKVRGKGNKERYIPIDSETGKMLEEHLINRKLETKDVSDPVFVNLRGNQLQPRSVERDLKKLKEILGMPESKKLTPHVFRHTGATHLRQMGMDLSELQDILGHANPATTKIYAKNDISQLVTSYHKYHPLAMEKESK